MEETYVIITVELENLVQNKVRQVDGMLLNNLSSANFFLHACTCIYIYSDTRLYNIRY